LYGSVLLVDIGFVEEIENRSLKKIEAFSSDISAGVSEIAILDKNMDEKISELQVKKKELENEIQKGKIKREEHIASKNVVPKRSLWEKLRFKEKNQTVQKIEKLIDETDLEIETLEDQLRAIENQIGCSELQKKGKKCEKGLSKLKKMFSSKKISDISKKIDETINDLITVLVSLVLTTIIMPLLFLFVAYKFFRTLSSSFFQNLPPEAREEIKGSLKKNTVQSKKINND
jgi:hypothetical protein